MIISLTGMPGSGKTTVGRIVADLLGCRFLDLDEEIVRQQRRSIPEIFEAEGEAGFRKIEGHTLRGVVSPGAKESPVPTLVLALGGGTLTKPGSARLIHEDTVCIYLRARVETLAERLASGADRRPLLAGASLEERLDKLLEERSVLYESTAHLTLDTDGNDPGDVASEIIVTAL